MKLLKKFFPASDETLENKSDEDQLQIATWYSSIEVSKSDDDYDIDEQNKIKSLLQKKFKIPADEIENIYELCDKSTTK